jgi:hypothetical protein
MPTIIDYPIVLDRLSSEGLTCHYYNGGSFGLADAEVRGWVGPPDETIKPAARELTRNVPEPFEATLTGWASRVWRQALPGNVWVMPASHWSFELTHGNQSWLPSLLNAINIDSSLLIQRTNAAAIEFLPSEEQHFKTLLEGLLTGLTASDFTLAFPEHAAVCMIHHHKQLWWVAADQQIVRFLDEIR